MADNVAITAGSGTTVAADEVTDGTLGTVKVQYVKLMTGALDGTNKLVVDAHGSMQSTIVDSTGTAVDFTAVSPVNITQVAGASIAQGHGTAATAMRVELPTDGTGVVGLNAGSNLIGKVGIDQTTPGTTDSVSVKSTAFDVATTITRPANTTAYTAVDVVGGALDLGVLGPSGKAVMITSAQLELDISAIPSGMTSFTLYLYNVTPPSATADNGAWDLPSGDRASFLGSINLGTPVDLGSTCYVEQNSINKQVILSGTHLFGYLVTAGGFTPAANSEVYKLTLHTLAV